MRPTWCGGVGSGPHTVMSTRQLIRRASTRRSSGFLLNRLNPADFLARDAALHTCCRRIRATLPTCALVGPPLARLGQSARRKDDAVLARSLCHVERQSAVASADGRPELRSFAATRWAAFASCCMTWPAMSRCWSGSTGTRTAADSRTKTSPASSWSCFRWASATIRNATSKKPPARSAAGTFARASSGQSLQHDDGDKTVFGEDGQLRRRRRCRALSEARRCAAIPGNKAAAVLRDARRRRTMRCVELAACIRENDYAMRPVLRTLLSSSIFFGAEARHSIIKSPAEFVLGTQRTLDSAVNLRESVNLMGSWANRCSSRRRSRAGKAAGRGSIRQRCWGGRISPPS